MTDSAPPPREDAATQAAPTDEVLAQARRWRQAGHPVALATVVATWGSSPRQPGSQLAVNADLEIVGSVSGGCIEGAVIGEAQAAMADGKARLLEFGVTNERAWEVGLACGGRIKVLVERVGDSP
ncbi:MAG: XdhC family protein [Rhodospirillales bacterium]|nr:XdhC family protein [Rhodospirillales bacterium]MDE0713121.1 XdhC family protein [Rhodospirillales bacterium]